jgi:prevent-host-death family protein
MRVVTPTDMRQRLGEILDAASAGERILIERDHRPLAVLVSVEDAGRLDEDRQAGIDRRLAALDRLAAFGKRMREEYPDPDDGLTTVEWIEQERERRTDQIVRAASGLVHEDAEQGGTDG